MSITFYPVRHVLDNLCYEIVREIEGVNLSNANAWRVMESIGISLQDNHDCGEMPINRFINLCRNWLRQHIDKPSPERPASRTKNIIDCGLREGYFNTRIHQLVTMATKGREAGASHISWG